MGVEKIMVKELINSILSKFGYECRRLIQTRDAIKFQREIIKKDNPVIFDVGAYDGRTSILYRQVFKNAEIYAFEPSINAHRILCDKSLDFKLFCPLNIALSNFSGIGTFYVNKNDTTNSLMKTDKISSKNWGESFETVKKYSVDVIKVDDFCSNFQIDKIDILKLDAQGSELDILDGAKNMLRQKKIGLICTEIHALPAYKNQCKMWEYFEYMEKIGYGLVGIFQDYRVGGFLGYMDAIFMPKK